MSPTQLTDEQLRGLRQANNTYEFATRVAAILQSNRDANYFPIIALCILSCARSLTYARGITYIFRRQEVPSNITLEALLNRLVREFALCELTDQIAINRLSYTLAKYGLANETSEIQELLSCSCFKSESKTQAQQTA